jgi:bifunctional non-homologous end joining protein LigD
VEYRFGDLSIACSHVDRVVFPESGITKGDVIAYYHDVADVALPGLRRRALTFERAAGIFQKHARKHYPAWIERVELGGKTPVEYPLCDSAAALVYFANQGAIALHVGTSRCDTPFHPDELVIDLDPPPGRFDLVRRAAPRVRALFEELGVESFVKTTGSAGLHVVVPLDGSAGYDVVEALCARLGAVLCERHPDLLTTEFYKKDRGGRLFLDLLRNAPGATAIAPYSLRTRPRAPVAAPIAWAELDDPALAPDAITLRDVRARLDGRGDPWTALRARPAAAAALAARL